MPMPWIYMAFDNPSENHLYCSCSNALQSLYAFIVMFWQCMLKKTVSNRLNISILFMCKHPGEKIHRDYAATAPPWCAVLLVNGEANEHKLKLTPFFLKLLLFQVEEMCCVKRRKGCLSLQNKPEWSHSCLVVLLLPVGSKYSTST